MVGSARQCATQNLFGGLATSKRPEHGGEVAGVLGIGVVERDGALEMRARSFEIFLALSDDTAQRAGGRVIRERLEDGDEESVCFLDIARHDRPQTQRDHALCVCRIHRRASSGDAT